MPPDPNRPPASPGVFLQRTSFKLPNRTRRELQRPGSLSRRMARWCEGALPVSVIRQGSCQPTADEARLLGLGPRQWVWVREVRLGPIGQPWINGRTVAPLKEMRGPMHALRSLGNKPLGSVLFNGRVWQRSPFLIGWLRLTDAAGAPGSSMLPARRSVFCRKGSRLLVTEGFYPAYWQRLQQEKTARYAPEPQHGAQAQPAPDPEQPFEEPERAP